MKIIADENMPWASELFSEFGEVHRVNGRQLSAEQLSDADVLLVRSVTQVDQHLLAKQKQLKFVGSATIGTDHIDQAYLAQQQIAFSAAPGCNAQAVGEYAFSALLTLAKRYRHDLKHKHVGIVGAGNTGSAFGRILQGYGVQVSYCDPFVEESAKQFLKQSSVPSDQRNSEQRNFVDLDTLIKNCNVISLHVPLVKQGEHATHHLFDHQRLARLMANAWLLNCCRGEVVDNHALYLLLKQRPDLKVVLDVWENEPTPMASLVPLIDIATPHIAGYSLEGKARGTYMLYQALCKHLGRRATQAFEQLLPQAWISQVALSQMPDQAQIQRLCHLLYDIEQDDQNFRQQFDKANGFDLLRKNHTHRREFSALTLCKVNDFDVDWLYKLGFS